MSKVNYNAILRDYLSDRTSSYTKLAKRYHISKQSIVKRAKKEDWQLQRREFQEEVDRKFTTNAAKDIEKVLAKELALSETMIDAGLEAFSKCDFSNITPHQIVVLLRTGIELERKTLEAKQNNSLASQIKVTTPIVVRFDDKRHRKLMDWLSRENAEFKQNTLPKLLEQDNDNKLEIQKILTKY